MEGDEIIQRQVSKFQKISCDGGDVDGGGGGGVGRLCGWPSSRIVRVSRASGGKDRHSKVLTSKGLRDRRIRLSVTTAIEFYDLQDRLGYDQPSKAVDWLIKAAASSIDELPSLDPSFNDGQGQNNHHYNNQNHRQNLLGADLDFEDLDHHQQNSNNNSNSNSNNKNVSLSKSSACSSTSETSKGSGLSLSRSENRIRARERARDLTAKKEKEKESVLVPNTVNSSFTDLLTGTGGITSPASTDYFQMPHFNLPANNHPPHHQHHQFSFLQENFAPVVAAGGAGGESYNLNFSIPSSSSSARGGLASGLNRGTLQSNLLSTWPHHLHLQRYPAAAMADGSATNFPFSITPDHFQANGYGGGDGGGRHSDYYKGKSKN